VPRSGTPQAAAHEHGVRDPPVALLMVLCVTDGLRGWIRWRVERRSSPVEGSGRLLEPHRVVHRRATSCRGQRRIIDGVTISPTRKRTGSSRLRAAITARSVQLIRGCGVHLRRTASWWRSTKISISLVVVLDRVRSTIQPRSLVNIR
jgi:hypothetical protein